MPARPVDFWSRVARGDGCWEWTGTKDEDGYGRFKSGGRMRRAHRRAWELVNGPIPGGLWVLHRCDNRACVRAEVNGAGHLYLGTIVENTADAVSRGRCGNGPGERNSFAKLSDAQVREIRRRYSAGGIYQRALAAEYGVTQSLISMIIRQKLWTHSAAFTPETT